MANETQRRYAWMALTTVCIMQVVWVGVGWNTLSLYAAPIIDEWGISRAGFMLTITLVATCNTVISLFFYGLLVQKLGVRKLVWVGGLLCTSGLAVFALSQGVWMLYATGILFGTGCALLNNNAVNTVVQAWFRRRTGTFISVASTFGSVAGIVAAIAVAALINSAGWRPALGATAILSVVGMMVCGVLYKGDPESLGVAPMYSETGQEGDSPGLESRPEGGPSYSSMIRSPRFWALGAVELAIGIVGYAVLANLALMVSDFGFGAYSGAALSVALAGSAVFLIPSGLILDKFGSAWLVALCFGFVVAAMLISFAGASSLPMVYVVAVLLGAGYDMCLTAPGITTLEAFGSREYARKMGTLCGFLYAGCAMGPTVMGLFADLGGGSYNTAFLVFTALGVISAVAIFPLTKVRRGRVGMGAPREASKDSFTA